MNLLGCFLPARGKKTSLKFSCFPLSSSRICLISSTYISSCCKSSSWICYALFWFADFLIHKFMLLESLRHGHSEKHANSNPMPNPLPSSNSFNFAVPGKASSSPPSRRTHLSQFPLASSFVSLPITSKSSDLNYALYATYGALRTPLASVN